MNKIGSKGLLFRVFTPALALSLTYLFLGHFCCIPHILLFCILGTFILMPMELGFILSASKKEYGTASLKSAFADYEKIAVWKILILSFVFFGIAGLLSAFIAPIENQFFIEIRSHV